MLDNAGSKSEVGRSEVGRVTFTAVVDFTITLEDCLAIVGAGDDAAAQMTRWLSDCSPSLSVDQSQGMINLLAMKKALGEALIKEKQAARNRG